jgi:hypothetical protein
MIVWRPLAAPTYQFNRYKVILQLEESGNERLNMYIDLRGIATTEAGFKLMNHSILRSVLRELDITKQLFQINRRAHSKCCAIFLMLCWRFVFLWLCVSAYFVALFFLDCSLHPALAGEPPGLRIEPQPGVKLYRSADGETCWPYLLYEQGKRKTLKGAISWRPVPFESLSEVEKARYVKQRFSAYAEQLCLRARGNPASSAPRPDPELDRCIEARAKTLFEHQASFAPIVAEMADVNIDGDGREERLYRIYFDKPQSTPYPFKEQGEALSPYVSIHYLGEDESLPDYDWGRSRFTQIIIDRHGRALGYTPATLYRVNRSAGRILHSIVCDTIIRGQK